MTRHLHPWPDHIIDLPVETKVYLMQRDPGRYFRQCRAERLEEVRWQVDRAERRRYHG